MQKRNKFDVCTVSPAPDEAKYEEALAPEAKYEEVVYESLDADEFVRDLRRLQHKNKFTDKTCLDFISLFSTYVNGGHIPAGFTECDKKLKEAAGIQVIELHGCSKCHGHVYGPDDKSTHCPCCGAARYEAETCKPTEVVYMYAVVVVSMIYFFIVTVCCSSHIHLFCSHIICFDCIDSEFSISPSRHDSANFSKLMNIKKV